MSQPHTDFASDDTMLVIQKLRSPEELLERRLAVLKGILGSEEVYLRELEALLTVKKNKNVNISVIFAAGREGCDVDSYCKKRGIAPLKLSLLPLNFSFCAAVTK